MMKLFMHKWALVTLAVGFLITVFAAMLTNTGNISRIEKATEYFSKQLSSDIVRRFELYQYGLRGSRGAILTAGKLGITRSSFQNYSATRDVNVEFPGALGFGFIRRVSPEDVTSFLASARSDDWPNFEIRELSPNNGEHYVIQYIEPVARNTQAVGLDIASELNRRTAARTALLSGEVRLTRPITLVQATGQPLQSFLILMPIYSTGVVPESEESRNQYGFGWSYAPLITGEVLANLNIDPDYHHIELTDVTEPENTEVFFTNDVDSSGIVFSRTESISVYGRTWQINIGVLPAFVSDLNQVNVFTIGLLGFMLTLLTSGLVGTNAVSRENRAAAIAEQSKLASIVSSSTDGIIGLTLKGDITSWNAGAENILGFNSTETLGRSYLEFIVKKNQRKRAQGRIDKVNDGDSVSSVETVHLHKDGREIPVSVTVSPIFAVQKKVSGMSVTLRDISEQKQTEQEIKDLNANLESQVQERTAEAMHVRDQLVMASDAAELGVWVWDCITNELNWNDKMFDMYEYPLSLRDEGIEYAHWLDRIHPDDQADATNSLEKALTHEEKWNSNFRLVWPNGQIRHINARALVNFGDDGTPLSVTGVNRDITSEVELELSLRLARQKSDDANAAKSTFLSNMSHEIRTPMNGIYGTLQLLKGEQLSEKGRGFINKAEYSCKNLLTIINDILDFSKIEAGQLDFENVPFSLRGLIEKISSDMLPLATDKNIIYEVNNLTTHDMWIGDSVRIGQVMLNVVSNAIKFTPQGKVTLSLSSQQQASIDSIVIEVAAPGIGMDKKAMDTLFSRFSQADDSITRNYGGSGLGMSITQSLVYLMEGQISVDSEINKGTTIRVILQLKKAQATADDLVLTATPESRLNLTGKHILIAEDNAINQVIIEAMLEPLNPTLTIVANGEEAVQSAFAKRPDLILMDIQMPVKDGVTACQEILAHMHDIPIVALTANVMAQDIDTYLKAGFVAHLGKPFEISVLEEKLRQLMLDS
jgi:PAS domain S-box-containing protein